MSRVGDDGDSVGGGDSGDNDDGSGVMKMVTIAKVLALVRVMTMTMTMTMAMLAVLVLAWMSVPAVALVFAQVSARKPGQGEQGNAATISKFERLRRCLHFLRT